jgi:arsenate reductase-like glutaredoxin family protein
MRFFGLKSCDTCRKALTQLRAAGHTPKVIDIRADGIDPVDLDLIIQAFGPAAINRASTTWRALSLIEQQTDPAQLLRIHPTLLKRPVIDRAGHWTQGWSHAVQADILTF